jgi:hypothetical protein
MNLVKAAWIGLGAGAALASALSQAAPIYSCVDSSGKRLTSDRPILDCIDREQRLHNSDGSVQKTITRTLTAEERAEKEARDREAATQRSAQQDAIRRDRNLLTRFPNRAAHDKAREAALDVSRNAMNVSEQRIAKLALERKPLMDETEFYVGKPLPIKLKRQIDGNDAANAAQINLIRDQRAEMARINALFDTELQRLAPMWAGALPGFAEATPSPSASARKSAASGSAAN